MASRTRTLCARGATILMLLSSLSLVTASCDEGAMAVLQVLGSRPDYKAQFSPGMISTGRNNCSLNNTDNRTKFIAMELWKQEFQGPEPYGQYVVDQVVVSPDCSTSSFSIPFSNDTTADTGLATTHYRIAVIKETTDEEGNTSNSIDSRSTPVSVY